MADDECPHARVAQSQTVSTPPLVAVNPDTPPAV